MGESTRPMLVDIRDQGSDDGFLRLQLTTPRGPVAARFYPAPGSRRAVLLVGGIGGGFDSPARDLYRELGEELPREGIAVLRVRFRDPTALAQAVYDVLAGIEYLVSQGLDQIALVGHSFGGAVVITAGARTPEVRAVVTLATQAYGTEDARRLTPRPLLLIHGSDDEVLPPDCSTLVHRMANEPKELQLVDGARHVLDEAALQIFEYLRAWLMRRLPA